MRQAIGKIGLGILVTIGTAQLMGQDEYTKNLPFLFVFYIWGFLMKMDWR